MDFYQIKERSTKNGVVEIYPDFRICRSKDLMVRGRSFYAIWDEERNIWSTDEYDVQRLVDADLLKHKEKMAGRTDGNIVVKLMSDFSSTSWAMFRKYMQNISDNAHQLDEKLTFVNTEVKKSDYISTRLPYPLEKGVYDAYDEIIGTLYDPDERAKLEWAIGAVVSGDAKIIQKFIVLYGEMGSGKSTILNIIQSLFQGYYTTFEAKALTSSSNSFSTEVFKSNPLIAIQHDGDLSKIEDNSKFNSIISHEEMTMNEKYKPSYTARVNSFLFMATNRPVKITDAKSGIIRRLIDVKPSGRKIPAKRYQALMSQVDFELGAIASHCLEVYRKMGKNYYASYRPLEMILQTDVFFNFIEANYQIFKEQDGVSLSQAYDMYKTYCDEALIEFKLPRHKFREEMKNYFQTFMDVARIEGKQTRSYYQGFISDKFTNIKEEKEEHQNVLVLDCTESIFDELCANCPSQYANNDGIPPKKWSNNNTKLSEINTKKLHYVKVPSNHIIIDFDLQDEKGNKSLERNVEAASKWPSTYAEFSKSGNGLHLHYIYDGDATKLSRVYEEGIEIKVSVGEASLRRKLTKCNNIPIMTINSGLPLKGEKMINFDVVKNEKAIRRLIEKNLHKEYHPGTKPSVDFIYKILDDAYKSGLTYDVTDLRPKLLAFANNSSHQADYCIKRVGQMKTKSDDISVPINNYETDILTFFDVEVFPNLFVIVWKHKGGQKVKMINPSAVEVEELFRFKLVGFNCRRYDNHILYAAYIGYNNEQLYELSQRLIKNSRNGTFGEAYNISYADVYDYSSKKQSLKKFEIELGIHHHELGIPWDQPVPKERWLEVTDYCGDDVDALEAVFDDPERQQDFVARQILADLSGLTVNDTTQMHTAKIIFGNDKRPQDKFIYTDLSKPVLTLDTTTHEFLRHKTIMPLEFKDRHGNVSMLPFFEGYTFDHGKSFYRGEETGEGGYVHAEPGMYVDVALLDVESMHPTSAIEMNIFGPYTKNYEELKAARLAIKHKDYELAKTMLGGILAKYLTTDEQATALSYALKIVINIVYGLTSAKFENKFKDPRNVDNIVAKRGALFMIDLKHAVWEKGFKVAHIKTDSIKIPNATPEIIQFVMEFGKKYGYKFEHEATYDRFCLVNDAVYIARYKDGKKAGQWTATGAQFAQPYVFKTLFSKKPIVFSDMCETKTVTSALYLDMIETVPTDEHNYHFVGKAGSFCPIKPGCGGGILLREKDGKYYAATGSKGYRWLEAEVVTVLKKEDDVDVGYYKNLVDSAVGTVSKFGDFEWFISDKNPWEYPECKDNNCPECPRSGVCIPF